MRRKNINYKLSYTIEEHAMEFFDVHLKYFSRSSKEFNIANYVEEYYNKNIDCFRDKDKLEIISIIDTLTEKGYIELASKHYNIVRITDKGYNRIESLNTNRTNNNYQ